MKNFAIKCRIYPTKEQEEYFEKCFRANNFIYNYFLSEQIRIDNMLKMYGLTNNKERNSYKKEHLLYFKANDAKPELTKMVNSTHQFLQDVDSTLRHYACVNLEKAFNNIYLLGSGFPKFKSNRKNKSFTGQIVYSKDTPSNFRITKIKEGSNYCLINIPKVQNLEVVIHRNELKYFKEFDLKPKEYTVCKTPNGDYYISIMIDNINVPKKDKKDKNKPVPLPSSNTNVLGVDLGVVRAITTSDINDFNNPVFDNNFEDIKEISKKIKVLQRAISIKMEKNKKYKDSNTYHRLRKKINSLENKRKKKREYYQHLITKELVNNPTVTHFVIEDLKVKNMTKRAKNKNVKQKSGLNRSILNIGFFGIKEKLKYKAEDNGKYVISVNPKNTSLMCSCCGEVHKQNRKTQGSFICIVCGHTENADFNASKNIKNILINSLKNNDLSLLNSK